MSLDSNALTNLADVKQALNLNTSTDYDELLETLTNAASKAIAAFCQRDFVSQSYTEYYDGTGTGDLVLNQRPIVTLTSVWEDSDREFGSDDLLTEADDDIVVDYTAGIISKIGSSILSDSDATWSSGIQSVKVTYTAGYTTVPFDVQQACIETVMHWYNNRGRLGLSSMSLGGVSVSFGKTALPEHVQAILAQHVSRRF